MGGPPSARFCLAISRPYTRDVSNSSVRYSARTYSFPGSALQDLRQAQIRIKLLLDARSESVEHDDGDGAELDDGRVAGWQRREICPGHRGGFAGVFAEGR